MLGVHINTIRSHTHQNRKSRDSHLTMYLDCCEIMKRQSWDKWGDMATLYGLSCNSPHTLSHNTVVKKTVSSVFVSCLPCWMEARDAPKKVWVTVVRQLFDKSRSSRDKWTVVRRQCCRTFLDKVSWCIWESETVSCDSYKTHTTYLDFLRQFPY